MDGHYLFRYFGTSGIQNIHTFSTFNFPEVSTPGVAWYVTSHMMMWTLSMCAMYHLDL
jgi:hypothetical protein